MRRSYGIIWDYVHGGLPDPLLHSLLTTSKCRLLYDDIWQLLGLCFEVVVSQERGLLFSTGMDPERASDLHSSYMRSMRRQEYWGGGDMGPLSVAEGPTLSATWPPQTMNP